MSIPPSHRRPLILGAAVGYSWTQIAPFVRSLRASGCTAEVGLLVSLIDDATRRGFAQYKITPLPVHPVASRLPPQLAQKRYNRVWLGWLHRNLPRLIGSSPDPTSPRNACLAMVASWFLHPACSRYLAYYRYLRPRVDRYDFVLTTDVRDVIFQADPFATAWRSPPSTGSVFLEHNAVHGNSEGNDRWVKTGFGTDGLNALRGCRVTCSGLSLAPAHLMIAYLAAMTRELALRADRFAGYDGMDQGVHNWLFHTGRLPGFEAIENFCGPVLTLHGLPSDLLRFDSADHILDSHDRIIPALHQYDRHPSLANRLIAKLDQRR